MLRGQVWDDSRLLLAKYPLRWHSGHIKLWIQVWQGALRQCFNRTTLRRLTVEMIEGLGGQGGLRAIGVHQL
jgi:hypothetical protein